MNFYTLSNSEGKEISVGFREFKPADANTIIDLLREEYGDTYRKRELYDPTVMIERQREGKFHFFVAQLQNGKVIGSLAFKRNLPREMMCEITMGIVAKPYRQYNVYGNLARYVAGKILQIEGVPSLYVRVVMYHDITQKAMMHFKFQPCGFVLSAILAGTYRHSYPKDNNLKHPHGVMVRKLGRHGVGTVYLPKRHEKIAKDVYSAIRAKVTVDTNEYAPQGESLILTEDDIPQQNCSIFVDKIGVDLVGRIRAIESQHTKPLQTYNVFLNISDKSAVFAYETLHAQGYFFAGFAPICGGHETMIMHNPCNVPIHFDTLCMIEPFALLRDYVQKCYEER